jgi:hypothetical protein
VERIIFIAMVCTSALGFLTSIPSISSSGINKDSDQVQEAYRAYVEAWKLKNIPALAVSNAPLPM